jgi:hypothetical protein
MTPEERAQDAAERARAAAIEAATTFAEAEKADFDDETTRQIADCATQAEAFAEAAELSFGFACGPDTPDLARARAAARAESAAAAAEQIATEANEIGHQASLDQEDDAE